jgi:hypothetical protein
MTRAGGEDMRLEHFCDMDLGYTTDFFLVQPYGGEEGSAYGEGDGNVTGEGLSGNARWSNHPHRRSDGSMLPNARGVIQTADGAHVIFDLQGRTIWSEDGSTGGQNLAITFEAEDDRYRWLNNVLCVGEGVIDAEKMRAYIGVYKCVNERL